jgi:hypothetical protein
MIPCLRSWNHVTIVFTFPINSMSSQEYRRIWLVLVDDLFLDRSSVLDWIIKRGYDVIDR